MKFPYQRYTVDVAGISVISRPEVPLRVIGDSGDVFLWALVDSGADYTVLPRSAAEAAGVNLEDTERARVGGFAGGVTEIMFADVTLQLGRSWQTYQWATKAGFVAFDEPEDEVVILGHAGCLEFFRATFDGKSKEVELLPTPE